MDILLASIAGLSLLLAVGMAAVLFNVMREERRRSDARVAALTAAAATAPLRRGAARSEPAQPVAARMAMFSPGEERSPWGRRAGAAAAVAGVLAVALMLLLPGPQAASRAQRPSTAIGEGQPLELVALEHARVGDGLAISGTVRNPSSGAALRDVFATAVLVAGDGSTLASARASLDFTTLAPGGDSPFVITVPKAGAVARYRVGFRSRSGAVIAHVDRRAESGPTARRGELPGE